MRLSKAFLVTFFLVLLLSTAYAVIEQNQMKVFAVTSDDEIALSADLGVTIRSGNGKVWSSVEPLIGTSTQTTEKIAVEVARKYSDRVDQFDYFFDINSTASLVDGPSAGAAMGLLLISMLQNKELPSNVSITGTITVDGGVGAVGGVFKKSQEAARIGMDLFMIPKGEARQMVKLPDGIKSINLKEYARQEWGLTVVEVSTIDDALIYAFSDIESIDINTDAGFAFDFIPREIDVPESIAPMNGLTQSYIDRAKVRLNEARLALSGTLLTDPSLVDAMLSLINQSEKTLERAKLLHERNYYYSAANFAFLASVNASMVKDISDNPSLLESGSTVWDLKLMDLKKQASSIRRDLNSYVPVDYLEWHIAAKERLTWAEEKLEKLINKSQTIVITVGGAEQQDDNLEDLRDLEYAAGWLEAARDFHLLGVESQKKVRANSHFENVLASYSMTVRDAMPLLNEEEKADITRRLDAAEIAKKRGWYSSALFDAASALALANASIYVKNKDLEELDNYLKLRIETLREAMGESKYSFVWAELYLAHAIYYSEAVDFYRSEKQTVRALEMASNGISLVFLAENMFNVGSENYAYFESIPEGEYVTIGPRETPFGSEIVYLALLLVLLAGAIVVLSVLIVKLSKYLRVLRHQSLDSQIESVKRKQIELDRQWDSKRIDEKEYEKKSLDYHSVLSQLLDEKSKVSHLLVDLDRDRAMLLAYEQALRSLKKRKQKGMLLKKDYQKNFDEYNRKIARLRKTIASGRGGISSFGKKPIKPKKYPLVVIKSKKASFKRKPLKSKPKKKKSK